MAFVVDLGTGKSWRALNDHPSTKAEPNFVPVIEGQKVMHRRPGETAKAMKVGTDGIAISADGSRLFYCALSSHLLFSVSTEALLNEKATPEEVAATVKDEEKKAAAAGLESDAQGRIYVTDYENNAVLRRNADGEYETLATDPRAFWPDTLSLTPDGYLYFTANQLHRQPAFHEGKDRRVKPYYLFRIKTDGTPVLLRN